MVKRPKTTFLAESIPVPTPILKIITPFQIKNHTLDSVNEYLKLCKQILNVKLALILV